MPASLPPPAGCRSAAAKARCWSSSDAMAFLQHRVRAVGFLHEPRKLGDIRVPLDERGLGAEARQRDAVQIPDFVADRGAMIVDEHFATIVIPGAGVPGQVDFADAVARQAGDESA